jgi:hypothetical protein
MALHINSGCFTVMGHSRVQRIRAVASDGSATTLKTVDDKVNLGGSDLKVSAIGIGAWAWGDTTYWNNFQWNGNLKIPFIKYGVYELHCILCEA